MERAGNRLALSGRLLVSCIITNVWWLNMNHALMVPFAGACFAIGKRTWARFVGGGTFLREVSSESWFNRLLYFQEPMHIKEKEVVDEACRGGDNNPQGGKLSLYNYHITERPMTDA
jgi:hypothetical protein